jgi:hypothetical protein
VATSTRRAALHVRVSTADRGQPAENQLAPLQEAAGRLGWTVVAVFRDEGISGATGRAKRPGLDALLKGVARREFNIVPVQSVGRCPICLLALLRLIVLRGTGHYPGRAEMPARDGPGRLALPSAANHRLHVGNAARDSVWQFVTTSAIVRSGHRGHTDRGAYDATVCHCFARSS